MFAGKTVWVESYGLDAESAALGGQLINALSLAGLNPQDRRMSIGALGSIAFGVLVSGPDTKLVQALLLNLTLTGDVLTNPGSPPASAGFNIGVPPGTPPADAVVFIGVKPLRQ
jgi:hypothetical protein